MPKPYASRMGFNEIKLLYSFLSVLLAVFYHLPRVVVVGLSVKRSNTLPHRAWDSREIKHRVPAEWDDFLVM